MRTIRTEFTHVFACLWRSLAAWGAVAAFIAAAAALFAGNLHSSEGTSAHIPGLWALASQIPLACLSAFVTMNLLKGSPGADGKTGRFDLELSVPVLERDIVFGRFLAAFTFVALATAVFWIMEWWLLPQSANAGVFSFRPAFAILLMQAALACATGIAASAMFADGAIAAAAAIIALQALPRAVFHGCVSWWPWFREHFAEVPFDAHAADFAAGDVSSGTVAFYLFSTLFMLFAASKKLAMARLAGNGARALRATTRLAVVLGGIFTALAVVCAMRYDFTVALESFPEGGGVSARTRAILADSSGSVRITAFLSRKDPSLAQVSRLMRRFSAAAASGAGMQIHTAFLDPRWDLGAASRLARLGIDAGSVVFERGRRRCVVDAKNADENSFAGALQSLILPAGRETVYFIGAHGEASIGDYSPYSGLSDIARDLRRDGYKVETLLLSQSGTVPGDTACLVSCAAETALSRSERTLLEGYLREGGRMLIFADAASTGAAALLSVYGLAAREMPGAPRRTSDGANFVAQMPKGHAITDPLSGTQLLFARSSVAFALPEKDNSALSRYRYAPLAEAETATGSAVFAASVETGSGASRELAYRPMRIVVIGDGSFPVNSSVENRANSNRDFILNAIAWLSGLDASGESGKGAETLETGMDRAAYIRFGAWTSVAFPLALFAVGAFLSRRRRS